MAITAPLVAKFNPTMAEIVVAGVLSRCSHRHPDRLSFSLPIGPGSLAIGPGLALIGPDRPGFGPDRPGFGPDRPGLIPDRPVPIPAAVGRGTAPHAVGWGAMDDFATACGVPFDRSGGDHVVSGVPRGRRFAENEPRLATSDRTADIASPSP
jgi:hypothetical protein